MKTSGLTGAALDWAVAKCEGATNFRYDTVATYWVTLDGKDRALSEGWAQSFCPSTDWAQGGPIIEREGITVVCWAKRPDSNWMAQIWIEPNVRSSHACTGPTPLIAAMRCYVHIKLGDEVDVPELLQGESK